MKPPFNIHHLAKKFDESLKADKEHRDKECKKGRHGFNTETWVASGWIYSRCKNCRATWRTEEMYFT